MFRYRVMHIGNILRYAVPPHSHPILLAKKQRYTSQVLNNEIYDPYKRIKLSRGSFFEIKLGGIGKIKSKKVAFSRSQKLSDALDVQLRTLCILPKRDF